MAADNLKYCKWCKHTMLKDATVCQQCRYGQTVLNTPGLSKIIEVASIAFALIAVIFAWLHATSAANSLAQSEQLSVEFDKQQQHLALMDKNANMTQNEAEKLSLLVSDSLGVLYQNKMDELATDKNLLDLLCPSELTEVSLRLDCDIRHVSFSARAFNALEWITNLSPSVAENSDIDMSDAIETICGYQPTNIAALFNAGDYIMGLENYVPFQKIPEIMVESPENLPTEGERQRSLESAVIELYKNESKKWINAGTNAYESIEKLCG